MPKPPDWGTPGCAWSENTPRAWVTAVDGVAWVRIGTKPNADGFEKKLNCPRCTHAMSVTKPGGVIIEGRTNTLSLDGRTEASCNCVLPHNGRPEKAAGCGQVAWVNGPP